MAGVPVRPGPLPLHDSRCCVANYVAKQPDIDGNEGCLWTGFGILINRTANGDRPWTRKPPTLNQRVQGSSPWGLTTKYRITEPEMEGLALIASPFSCQM